MRWVFAVLIAPVLLLLLALGGCATGKDPVVGTWKDQDQKMICNSDGTGVRRFDRHFFDPNPYFPHQKPLVEAETKFKWKKIGPKTYVFYYQDHRGEYEEQGAIENGELVFDKGDYQNRMKK